MLVQDVRIVAENVLFYKEKYYSPSKRKTYLAELPKGYEGQFGPGIKSLILILYFGVGTSEPTKRLRLSGEIVEFLKNLGVQISKGEVSNLLIQDQDSFHTESEAVYEAGLRSSPWQQADHTETRVDGQNEQCRVVCNPVYTFYHTQVKKDRLSVLDVLRQGRKRIFRLNGEALDILKEVPLSKAAQALLPTWCSEAVWEEADFIERLDQALPNQAFQSWIRSCVTMRPCSIGSRACSSCVGYMTGVCTKNCNRWWHCIKNNWLSSASSIGNITIRCWPIVKNPQLSWTLLKS